MSHLNKIAATSSSRQHPSELESSIASAIFDLETNIADMKSALRPLQFVSAREVSFPHRGNTDPRCGYIPKKRNDESCADGHEKSSMFRLK